MKKILLFTLSLVSAVLFIAIMTVRVSSTDLKTVNAEVAPFDHSNCQYPDRWSNPPNGCNNSDPAVPECIKSAYSKESEDACIKQIIADQQPKPLPTEIEQPAVAEYGGK